jgi:radical SAM superfamily enzyme YgiQ (UPF0313 family)
MNRLSVKIMRGCFGGCSFCSITEYEGRLIQSRSEESILNEIENIRDKTPGCTDIMFDLGCPTTNMWRLACKSREIESSCRHLSACTRILHGHLRYLIAYFIAGHPGTRDEDMLSLGMWLKSNGFKADQVQRFYPSPMASVTAMYHSGKNPLQWVGRSS